jgi:uncharacterized membrane protein
MEVFLHPIPIPHGEYALVGLRMLATIQIILATSRNIAHKGAIGLSIGLTVYCAGLVATSMRGTAVGEPLRLHTLLLNVGLIAIAHQLSRVREAKRGRISRQVSAMPDL